MLNRWALFLIIRYSTSSVSDNSSYLVCVYLDHFFVYHFPGQLFLSICLVMINIKFLLDSNRILSTWSIVQFWSLNHNPFYFAIFLYVHDTVHFTIINLFLCKVTDMLWIQRAQGWNIFILVMKYPIFDKLMKGHLRKIPMIR